MSGERCKTEGRRATGGPFGCAARSVEFDIHTNGGERQDQIEALDPQDLVTALNHGWCRREPIRVTRPDMSLVFVLLEHEVGHEARQLQVFSGLVAKVDPGG